MKDNKPLISAGAPKSQPEFSFPTSPKTLMEELDREQIENLIYICKKEGYDAWHVAQLLLWKLLKTTDRMHSRIEEAFECEPFIRSKPPDGYENQQRFHIHLSYHKQVAELLHQLIDLTIQARKIESSAPTKSRKED